MVKDLAPTVADLKSESRWHILRNQRIMMRLQISNNIFANYNFKWRSNNNKFWTSNQPNSNSHPNDIIQNFNVIPLFAGAEDLNAFLNNVNSTLLLCGSNEELKAYCLQKIVQTTITGPARSSIAELQGAQRNWENVAALFRNKYRPKTTTIPQQMHAARELKVFNLKDLINKLNSIKNHCNEIGTYDDRAYNHLSVDNELVQILEFKLVASATSQINSESQLWSLLELLSP